MSHVCLRAAFVLLVATTAAVSAQSLPGLPMQPAPVPVERKTDCSEKSVKELEQQLEQLQKLEETTPETIGLFCSGLEMFSKLMDWKDDEPLPPAINDLAKEVLKQNITPRMVKAMCRQAEGETGRNTRTEIGALKARLQGCKGV